MKRKQIKQKAGLLPVLAGETLAYTLLGTGGLPEPLHFTLSLAAGAAAGAFWRCGLAAAGKKGNRRPEKPGREERQMRELPAAGRGQEQRLEAAAQLAAQLEADARRLLTQQAALQREQEERDGSIFARLQQIEGQAQAAASAAQHQSGVAAETMRQAAGKQEKACRETAQELASAAFSANLLALRLQQAGQVGEKVTGQAAAEGLRLLATRCGRCGKQLSEGWQGLPDADIGPEDSAAQVTGLLQPLLEEQQGPGPALQQRKVALQETAEGIAGQAKALTAMLQGREKETAGPGRAREGTIEGTALRYRLE